MKNKMKKRSRLLLLFSAVVIMASLIVTVIFAREYSLNTYYIFQNVKVTGTHYTTENDNVEVKYVSTENDIVRATFVPKSFGADTVRFYTETNNKPLDADVTLHFFSGPFGTIFSFNSLIDFEGSLIVICLALLLTAAFAVALLFSFADYIRCADFGYPMVACGGVGLFCLHHVFATIGTLLESFRLKFSFGLGEFLLNLTDSGEQFSQSLAFVMAVFCTMLIISNVSLVRHEGCSIRNLLGVFLGVLWLAGYIFNRFFFGKSFDDEFRIYTSVSNAISVLISYFECMLFSTALSAFLASRIKPPHDRDYVVILGCAIRSDGSLTPILRGRVDAAISFAENQFKKTGKKLKFVPSGGQGSDEIISEGEAMKRYLIEQGIEEERILPEMKSVNTFENIKLSREIIEADAGSDYNAAFSTTNYHVFRGYILCKKLGLKNARGISATTKWYFFPNAFLRELVGLFVDKRKLHIFVILLIILIFTAINLIAA